MGQKVEIKFRPRFEKPMLNGAKTMTARTNQMGEPGDTFEIFGATFEITHVMRMELRYIASDCFEQEGVNSVQEFMGVWNDIHQKRGFVPTDIVWAHCFRRVR